jgi:hypothetical protein
MLDTSCFETQIEQGVGVMVLEMVMCDYMKENKENSRQL